MYGNNVCPIPCHKRGVFSQNGNSIKLREKINKTVKIYRSHGNDRRKIQDGTNKIAFGLCLCLLVLVHVFIRSHNIWSVRIKFSTRCFCLHCIAQRKKICIENLSSATTNAQTKSQQRDKAKKWQRKTAFQEFANSRAESTRNKIKRNERKISLGK